MITFKPKSISRMLKKIIREDYRFQKEILDPCKEVVDQFDNPIFIHVRRGDYVNQPDNHPVCPISYYEKGYRRNFLMMFLSLYSLTILIGVVNNSLMTDLFFQLRI